MKKARDLYTLLANILIFIPESEKEFRYDIEEIKNSNTMAPEVKWFAVAQSLQDYIDNDFSKSTDWQKIVLSLWMNKPWDTLKGEYEKGQEVGTGNSSSNR